MPYFKFYFYRGLDVTALLNSLQNDFSDLPHCVIVNVLAPIFFKNRDFLSFSAQIPLIFTFCPPALSCFRRPCCRVSSSAYKPEKVRFLTSLLEVVNCFRLEWDPCLWFQGLLILYNFSARHYYTYVTPFVNGV